MTHVVFLSIILQKINPKFQTCHYIVVIKSKRNNVNGNENVNKNEVKATAKAPDSSQQGRGVRLPPRATIEKLGDSRKSSVSSTSGAQMWPKCRTSSLADPTPEQVRTEARGLVEVVRELTGLSHTVSQVRQLFEVDSKQ